MIGIDWGTSSFRAYLLASDGALIETVSRTLGILNVPDKNFAAVLDDTCAKWINSWPDIPILMCGMIGSQQGWREAPYLKGKAGPAELAALLSTVNDHRCDIRIVCGLEGRSFGGGPDVMRGEETILVGALAQGAPQTGLYCLPGTHSKWAKVSNGKIDRFSTFLTGELFSLLCEKSILHALIKADPGKTAAEIDAAFLRGVKLAFNGEGLSHQLFAIRASVLTAETRGWATREMLSGLLIGAELAALYHHLCATPQDIIILASGEIGKRYKKALNSLGLLPAIMDAQQACRMGLYSIALQQFPQAEK